METISLLTDCIVLWSESMDLFCDADPFEWCCRKKRVIRCPWLKWFSCRSESCGSKTFPQFYVAFESNSHWATQLSVSLRELAHLENAKYTKKNWQKMAKRLAKLAKIEKQSERMEQKWIAISFVSFLPFHWVRSLDFMCCRDTVQRVLAVEITSNWFRWKTFMLALNTSSHLILLVFCVCMC